MVTYCYIFNFLEAFKCVFNFFKEVFRLVKKVFIGVGHGGKDFGAVGYLVEK